MGNKQALENFRFPLIERESTTRPLVSLEDRAEFRRQQQKYHIHSALKVGNVKGPKEYLQRLQEAKDKYEDEPISPVWGIAQPSDGLRKAIPGIPGPGGSLPDMTHTGMEKKLYKPNDETSAYPVEVHKYSGKLKDGTGADTKVVLFPDPNPDLNRPVLKIFQEVDVCYDKPQTITLPTTPPGGKSLTLKDVTCVHLYKLSDQSEVVFFEPPKRRQDGTIEYNEVSSINGQWEVRTNTTDVKIPKTHRAGFRKLEAP